MIGSGGGCATTTTTHMKTPFQIEVSFYATTNILHHSCCVKVVALKF